MTSWKPEGYVSVSPYLVSADPQRTIDFLVAVLDGKPLRRFEGPPGEIHHAEVKVDDSVVMLGGMKEGAPKEQPHLHVYVPDVDATYRKALAYGATSVQEPVRKSDEDKRGAVQDANGVTWWISTQGAK